MATTRDRVLKDRQAYILFYAQGGEPSKQIKNGANAAAPSKQHQNREPYIGDDADPPRFDKTWVKQSIGKLQPATRLPYPKNLQLLSPDDTLKKNAKTTEHPKNESPLSKVQAAAVAASAEQPPELDRAQSIQDNPPSRAPIKTKGRSASIEPRQTRSATKKQKLSATKE